MKKYLILVLLLVCVTGFTQTQSLPPLPPYLEVTGSAEMLVKPDVYYINLRMNSEFFSNYSSQEKRVGNELSKAGIPSADISLTAVGFDWQKQGLQPNDRAQYQDYVLRIQTDKQLIDIFNALRKAGTDRSFVASVDFTKKDQILTKLGIDALKNAFGKAESLASSFNSSIYQPSTIVEEYSGAEIFKDGASAPYNAQRQNDGFDRTIGYSNYESIPFKVSYRVTYYFKSLP